MARCLGLLLGLALAASLGCHVDVSRVRRGTPLDLQAFERLQSGRSTLDDALAALGAPDRLEWKNGKDYLWYLHEDVTRVGIRLQSPVSVFGYRHTFAQLEGDREETDQIELVFDERSVLERKSLRLAPGGGEPVEGARWRVSITPRYAYSPVLFGDGGEEPFADLFEYGQLFGLEIGVEPTSYLNLSLRGNYQVYEGDEFRDGARVVGLDDLELYQVTLGGRLIFPARALGSLWKLDELKDLFREPDVVARRGLFLSIDWSLGATYADSVPVSFDGQPAAATYFDHSLSFTSTVGAGIEYSLDAIAIRADFAYQTIDAFDEGSADLDTDNDGLSNFLFGGSVSLRF